MRVLADTSVWIEYFRRGTPPSLATCLNGLIEKNLVVTCLPVKAEVFSGPMDPDNRRVIRRMFGDFPCADPDWNDGSVWDRVADMAIEARKTGRRIPGLVDRMIAVAAEVSGAHLWTLDAALAKLAESLDIPLVRLTAPSRH